MHILQEINKKCVIFECCKIIASEKEKTGIRFCFSIFLLKCVPLMK